MKTLLVCGDRYWKNEALVEQILKKVPLKIYDTLIHGACDGADVIAGRVGKRLGFKVIGFPADWIKLKKAAGPIRNSHMLKEGKPDLVIAFHSNLAQSKGTQNMISQVLKSGKDIQIMHIDEKFDYSEVVIN